MSQIERLIKHEIIILDIEITRNPSPDDEFITTIPIIELKTKTL